MRKLFFTVLLSLLSFTPANAAVTPPWSTTFNCADWQAPNSLSCDGIGVYGPNDTCSGTVSEINSAGNNASGGGGKGWRVAVGDGINIQSAAPRITFSPAPSEVWFRWYMRFPTGFAWTNLDYHKLVYVDTTSQMNMGVYEFYGSTVRYYDQYGGTATHLGTADRGFYWLNGSVGDGQWHCYELHLKKNTSGNNGVAEAWLDGTMVLSSNTVNFGGADFDAFNLNVNQRSPANGGCVYVDYDDIAISTTGYIGLLGAVDTTPAAFSFTDQTGVALGSTNNSDNVTVAGIDNQTTLALSGDASCKYSINGAAWATANDNVSVNDNVALQNVASGTYSTAVSCTLNIGGVSDTWSRTTLAAVSDPVAPRFRGSSMSGGWR